MSVIRVAPRAHLTRADYFKLHGEPEGETRALMLMNADRWLLRANTLLEWAWADDVDVGIDQISGTPIASGRRPPGANAATANAAAASTHLTCEGGDIQDLEERPFACWLVRQQGALERAGLFMEDPRWTGGRTNTDPWAHLQTKAPRSGNRIYIPVDPLKQPATDTGFYSRNGLLVPAYLG